MILPISTNNNFLYLITAEPLVLVVVLLLLLSLVIIAAMLATIRRLRAAVSDISPAPQEESRGETPLNSDSGCLSDILLESAEDGIALYDSNWQLLYANRAFFTIVGLAPEDYSSDTIDELIHPDDRDYHSVRNTEVPVKGSYTDEIRLRHKDGHYVVLSTKTVVVNSPHNNPATYLTICRDITSIRALYDDLLSSKEEAEMSSRLKASFMANISHEVRTPLNSVVGFANLLMDNALDAKTKYEYIEQINFNSEKLLQIIGDIIDLARLENSEVEISYEEVSVSQLINDVESETRKIISREDKPLIFFVRSDMGHYSDTIYTDPVWLKRALRHLLDNAVKFTLEGEIDLFYGCNDSHVFFRVRDTGVGIHSENLETIFEGFRQEVDGHHRPFDGLGVGLTLVREVVERMGGEVTVRSEKGEGSEFELLLPYRPAGTAESGKSTCNDKELAEWSGKRCLIVDDNRDVLIYLERILSDTGIDVITSRSGAEAIEIVKGGMDIDIVLLDMQMPDVHGIEVARALRSIKSDIPIVAQTAFIFEDDRDIILDAGCDSCLLKPVRREQLIAVMSGLL